MLHCEPTFFAAALLHMSDRLAEDIEWTLATEISMGDVYTIDFHFFESAPENILDIPFYEHMVNRPGNLVGNFAVQLNSNIILALTDHFSNNLVIVTIGHTNHLSGFHVIYLDPPDSYNELVIPRVSDSRRSSHQLLPELVLCLHTNHKYGRLRP